jgi:hypothetical protein
VKVQEFNIEGLTSFFLKKKRVKGKEERKREEKTTTYIVSKLGEGTTM